LPYKQREDLLEFLDKIARLDSNKDEEKPDLDSKNIYNSEFINNP
jgi:hypothetical protein